MKKLTIIGCGNLGQALLKGSVSSELQSQLELTGCDTDEEKLQKLSTAFGIATSTSIPDSVSGADIVVLAVKPKDIEEIAGQVQAARSDSSGLTVMSVAAGVLVSKIQAKLPQADVVRLMPNVASIVSAGMTGIYSSSQEAAKLAEGIFSVLGETLVVKDEAQLHAVTGLSGSGPAYVFMVIDALSKAGVEAGLSKEDALKLATQTVLGAAEMVNVSKEEPFRLVEMVTSPGGTTIEGLKELDSRKLTETLKAAVAAATARSKELSSS